MLVDGVTRLQLQGLALKALRGAATAAGDRVYEPRDWPTTAEFFPLLLVTAPRDRKVGINPGQLMFNTTISLVVVGRVQAETPEEAYIELDLLAGQAEEALMFDPEFARGIQQWAVIDTTTTVTSAGRSHVGEFGLTMELTVYQAFWPGGDALVQVAAKVPVGDQIVKFNVSTKDTQ